MKKSRQKGIEKMREFFDTHYPMLSEPYEDIEIDDVIKLTRDTNKELDHYLKKYATQHVFPKSLRKFVIEENHDVYYLLLKVFISNETQLRDDTFWNFVAKMRI